MSKPEFVYVIYIQASRESVWDALTDPEMTKEYWAARNRSDWRAGSSWRHEAPDDASSLLIGGSVLESARPHRLVLTWSRPRDLSNADAASRVAFDIEDVDGATRLTVTHSKLDPDMLRGITSGWPAVLSSLKTMLETGASMPMSRKWHARA